MMPNANDPKVIERGQEFEDALKKEVWLCIGLFLLITVIFFCLHFVPFLKPSFETTGSWLERSGALVGAMAMYIEFRSRRISTLLDNASVGFPPEIFKKINKFASHEAKIHKVVLIYGIAGAVIWSYGSPILQSIVSLIG